MLFTFFFQIILKFYFSCTDALCKLIVKILTKTFTQVVDERVHLFQEENLQSCTNVYPSCSQDGKINVYLFFVVRCKFNKQRK